MKRTIKGTEYYSVHMSSVRQDIHLLSYLNKEDIDVLLTPKGEAGLKIIASIMDRSPNLLVIITSVVNGINGLREDSVGHKDGLSIDFAFYPIATTPEALHSPISDSLISLDTNMTLYGMLISISDFYGDFDDIIVGVEFNHIHLELNSKQHPERSISIWDQVRTQDAELTSLASAMSTTMSARIFGYKGTTPLKSRKIRIAKFSNPQAGYGINLSRYGLSRGGIMVIY